MELTLWIPLTFLLGLLTMIALLVFAEACDHI